MVTDLQATRGVQKVRGCFKVHIRISCFSTRLSWAHTQVINWVVSRTEGL